MGWLKNKNLGPIKINFSKAGIKVSFGVTGSKDNLVITGCGGFNYRREKVPAVRQDVELQEIETASIEELIAHSSDELTQEINEKQQRVELFVVGLGVLVVLFVVATFYWGIAVGMWILLLGLGLIPLRIYDRKNKVVRLSYDLTGETKKAYQCMLESLLSLQNCSEFWRIEAQGEPKDGKYSAEASALIKKSPCTVVKSVPKFIDTNVEIFQIYCDKLRLCFLPDRLLLYEGKKVTAIQYADLNIEVSTVEVVIEGKVPKDGKQVGKVWKYVNKDGSPDRRFANNEELPVMLYGVIKISSPSGLNLYFNCSNPEVPELLKNGINRIGICS
jgi:stress response protein SCP2